MIILLTLFVLVRSQNSTKIHTVKLKPLVDTPFSVIIWRFKNFKPVSLVSFIEVRLTRNTISQIEIME